MYSDIIKFYKDNDITDDKIKSMNKFCLGISEIEETVRDKREILIKKNSRLVVSRAKRFSNKGLELNDLIQEGNLGLIRAVDKFDPNKNVKVSTYATWWIDQAIRRAISNKSKTVRIPIHIQDMYNSICKSITTLTQKLGKQPSVTHISEDCGLSIEQIDSILSSALHPIGLNDEFSNGVTYEDVLADKEVESIPSQISKIVIKDKIRIALSSLIPRHQKIIRLRFGIGEIYDHTLEEIGAKFGVTKTRIRHIQNEAIEKLKLNRHIRSTTDE